MACHLSPAIFQRSTAVQTSNSPMREHQVISNPSTFSFCPHWDTFVTILTLISPPVHHHSPTKLNLRGEGAALILSFISESRLFCIILLQLLPLNVLLSSMWVFINLWSWTIYKTIGCFQSIDTLLVKTVSCYWYSLVVVLNSWWIQSFSVFGNVMAIHFWGLLIKCWHVLCRHGPLTGPLVKGALVWCGLGECIEDFNYCHMAWTSSQLQTTVGQTFCSHFFHIHLPWPYLHQRKSRRCWSSDIQLN